MKSANKVYAKQPSLRKSDIGVTKKIIKQISRSKAVECKLKMLCKNEKLTISFFAEKDPKNLTVAISNTRDRSIKVRTGIKENLSNKQTFVHEGEHLWVAKRNRNIKKHYTPELDTSLAVPYSSGEERVFAQKIDQGFSRLTRLLYLMDHPHQALPLNKQQQDDLGKLEKLKKLTVDRYEPYLVELNVKAGNLKRYVKKGQLDKNYRLMSKKGFEFIPDFDKDITVHFVSIFPLTPKKGTPKEDHEYRVTIRTVSDPNYRTRAAIKDGICMIKQHIPGLASSERLLEADAYLRQLYEYTSESIPEGEEDSNIFPILFEELHQHDFS